MKISEYPKATSLKPTDIFVVDSLDGTRSISASQVLELMNEESDILPIDKGGTGADNAVEAFNALVHRGGGSATAYDADTLFDPGFYGMAAGGTNYPPGTTSGNLLIMPYRLTGNIYPAQFFISHHIAPGPQMWFRLYDGPALKWTSWTRVRDANILIEQIASSSHFTNATIFDAPEFKGAGNGITFWNNFFSATLGQSQPITTGDTFWSVINMAYQNLRAAQLAIQNYKGVHECRTFVRSQHNDANTPNEGWSTWNEFFWKPIDSTSLYLTNNFAQQYYDGKMANRNNAICIGYGATPTAGNQITLGNSSITALRCAGPLQTLSDPRAKIEVEAINNDLLLKALMGIPLHRFEWNPEIVPANGSDKVMTGFYTSDVKKYFKKSVHSGNKLEMQRKDKDGNLLTKTITREEEYVEKIDDVEVRKTKTVTEEVPDMMTTLEDAEELTMDFAIPTLWGVVQHLVLENRALTERMNDLEARLQRIGNCL